MTARLSGCLRLALAIRHVRSARRLTQAELADRISHVLLRDDDGRWLSPADLPVVAQAKVGQWETGQRAITPRDLERLEGALRVHFRGYVVRSDPYRSDDVGVCSVPASSGVGVICRETGNDLFKINVLEKLADQPESTCPIKRRARRLPLMTWHEKAEAAGFRTAGLGQGLDACPYNGARPSMVEAWKRGWDRWHQRQR